jgi:hypothetical protein
MTKNGRALASASASFFSDLPKARLRVAARLPKAALPAKVGRHFP